MNLNVERHRTDRFAVGRQPEGVGDEETLAFVKLHDCPAEDAAQPDAAASAEALKFFGWAYKNGAKMAEELDYIPMPDNVVALSRGEWAKIKDPAGKPVFAMP